jgi:hypothetical protein
MKDVRGGHVSAVRNAIFRTFGLHSLAVNRRRNSLDILQWKKSKEVGDSYKKLFNDDTVIESITVAAFPTLSTADDEEFNEIYIYTASVCDIILNPDNPSMEVSKKSLELRMRKFKVFIDFIIQKKIKLLIKIKINILGSS